MSTLLENLVVRLQQCAKCNGHVEVPPAVILWTDPDLLWTALLPAVRHLIPVLELGEYAPEQDRGPVSWIKTALAGKIHDWNVVEGVVPILYLPGVSLAKLRETRECPVPLQPLIELLFRGVAWHQKNGHDVTVHAFLSAKEFLGLDVARDGQTAALLPSAMSLLFAKEREDLQGERIDASFLQELLQPDLARAILSWMNSPVEWKTRNRAGWDAFAQSVKAKARFDVERDGHLVALEHLAERKGIWAEWWERFEENPDAYPGILAGLQQLPVDAFASGATYPTINLSREESLKAQLVELVASGKRPTQAEWTILREEWEERSVWLWLRMGHSPVLALLRHILDLESALQAASPTETWLEWYGSFGWKVDAVAMNFGDVPPQLQDLARGWLKLHYAAWLDQTALRFQAYLREAGLPASQAGSVPKNGEVVVFIDGLRMDVAQMLGQILSEEFKVSSAVEPHWSTSPTVTATGKAKISPVAAQLIGTAGDEGFVPRFQDGGAVYGVASQRVRLDKLGVQHGVPFDEFDPSGMAWLELGDIDSDGHARGWRMAANLREQAYGIAFQLNNLVQAGWQRIRVVTDHGWLLLPDGLPVSVLPSGCTQEKWGRCAVLKAGASSGLLELPWSWSREISIAYPPGIACFKAGEEYSHGGLSPQEMIVPQLVIEANDSVTGEVRAKVTDACWAGLKCRVELQGSAEGMVLDLRLRPADAASSLLLSPKIVNRGDEVVTLFVENDDYESASAHIVLEADGALLDKWDTTVGGA